MERGLEKLTIDFFFLPFEIPKLFNSVIAGVCPWSIIAEHSLSKLVNSWDGKYPGFIIA